MLRKFFFLVSFSLVMFPAIHACDCVPTGGSFCQSLQNDPYVKTVVMVRKTADYLHGMKVELIQHLAGESVADTFMIWGDNNTGLCRPFAGYWAIDDTIIMALHTCDLAGNGGNPNGVEQPSDYMISYCGIYRLQVFNGRVTGFIYGSAQQSVPLDVFLASNCTQTFGMPPSSETQFSIYPNPASGWISFTSSVPLEASYSIVDVTGRSVMQGTIAGTTAQADLSALAAGLYTVTFTSAGTQRSYRFIRKP